MSAGPSDAHCLVCGERLGWNNGMQQGKYVRGQGRGPETPHPRLKGNPAWYHNDAMKRDHPAIPHDGRSHEEEAVRHAAHKERAELQVRQTLQRNFDYLHAESTVNDIFKDRRE